MPRENKRLRAKPVSLSPLEPEEALAGLFQVKPEQKETPVDEEREQETEPEEEEPS